MSNGEKIPPGDMELHILRDALFDQAMVYGEGRPFLVVLAVLNPDAWNRLAQGLDIKPDMPESLSDARVEKQALARIADQIADFPGYARIRRVHLMLEPWTIENDLLTPTLKVKRDQVAAYFAEEIKGLYVGH